ncbi:MAG: bile acid:sodium symporter family protein [Sulfuritalea sp.]|nr:bile acid:sodium symporter family protein [Sulfuritalea sp.]
MVTDKLLPLALAFIMFALGLGLTLADFGRVFRQPRAIAAGLASQMLLLPLVGFAVALLFGLPPDMAAGLMLIAACPGGASAGLITKLARGETALSISLTAITSVLAVLSVPLVIGFALRHFTATDIATNLPVFEMVRGVFVITTVPVALGMLLRHLRPAFTTRIEPVAGRIATLLFVAIVVATFVSQRQVLFDHLAGTGPAALTLCALTMAIGFGLGALVRIERRGCIAIAVETGVQNAALAIFLALSVLKMPAMAVPGVIYALLMNVCAIIFIGLMRLKSPSPAAVH